MDADVPVVIAAGHDVVMRVVRASCDAEGGIRIVGEVRDGRELLPACRSAAPRVVVIDDRLDDAPGFPTLRSLRDAGASVAAVVLSDRTDGASILAAMQLGARGYLRRGALTGVGAAVRDVAAGRRAIDPALERAAVTALGQLARQAREGSAVQATLTPREREILSMVSQGLTMQQAARRLGISPRTVETHISKLYRKLGVRTRLQAVARAAELGLIEP